MSELATCVFLKHQCEPLRESPLQQVCQCWPSPRARAPSLRDEPVVAGLDRKLRHPRCLAPV